ncbi:STAS domain-containing protein [Candidatus Peregrinibacteria bacterium]|nr:STAS domain-containing protein [Candidatus Peregrinibacteria bacterium]
MVSTYSLSTEIIRTSFGLIHAGGEIDQTGLPDLENAVKPLLGNPALKILVLDCAALTFINSKVVGYLVYLHTTLAKSGRKLILAGLNETLTDILSLVGLITILPHYETWEQAVENSKS